ncbi:MAG TPA: hypothetical protein VK698_16010 [Kofleriaceae bacterium]|nr:hypothetical protein [Kofleriaceae bacterium]
MIRRFAGTLLIPLAAGLAVGLAPACGGTPKPDSESPGESEGGQSAGTDDDDGGGDQTAEDGGDQPAEDGGEGETAEGAEGEGTEGTTEQGPPPAVTFVLKNSDATELAFNMDLGWQPNLFAYTGKPPRAVSILMFAKFCTASCDVAQEERCPICEQPEKAKDILAAQKMEKVAPGEELEVPWDGQMFVYEKTRGKRKARCECHRPEPAPAGTYTVKACGLRLTTTAEERSKLQCVEAEMTLPSDEPQRVELDFGKPQVPGKKKKHR